MKILLVTPLYPPEIGGPATYARLLMQEIPKRGHGISLVKFSDVAHLPPGIRHVVLFFKVLNHARHVDVILAQDVFSVGVPAVCAAWCLRKPLFVRVPGDFAWEQSRQRFGVTDSIEVFQTKKYDWRIEWYKKVERWVVNHAVVVMTPSNYFSDMISGWMKYGKPYTVYNGIDVEALSQYTKATQTHDSFSIVSAGRMVPWKGFQSLIDVLVDHPAWKLTLIGDGPEKENLIAHARSLGLSDRVTFTGALSQSSLFTTIAEADAFVLNSSFESFSFQVVEVMALGVPVVATTGCNLSEIITHTESGLLIPPGDARALEETLVLLNADSSLRQRLAAEGRLRAASFSIQRTVDSVLGLMASHVQKRQKNTTRVILVGSDRSVFTKASRAQQRIARYGVCADEVYVVVPTLRDAQYATYTEGNVTFIPTRSYHSFFYAFDVLAILFSLSRRNVIISPQDAGFFGALGLFVAWITRAYYYPQMHTDIYSPYYTTTLKKKIERWLTTYTLRYADSVRVVSERIKQSIATKTQGSISVIPIFNNVALRPHDTQTRTGTTFLVLSRLEAEKNITRVIDAFACVAKEHEAIRLIIAGEGTLRADLEKLVVEKKLSDRISVRGFVSDIQSIFNEADIFIQNSWYEGYGLSLVEALMSGVPVITTNVGNVPEYVVNGKNGYVYEPGDTNQLIHSMRSIVENPDTLQSMRSYTREHPPVLPYTNEEHYITALQLFYE